MIGLSTHAVCLALKGGDSKGVRSFVREMFDLEIPDEVIEKLFKAWGKLNPKGDGGWNTSAGPAIWIKSRIAELCDLSKLTPTVDRPQQHLTITDATTAVLHVFFTTLEETEEMLIRLTNERRYADGSPARSKISKANEVIQPIDGTARWVSGFPTNEPNP